MMNSVLALLSSLALADSAAALEERGGDVWCNEFEPGEGYQQDCSLLIPGAGFLHFDYTEVDYDYTLDVTQHTFGQHGWMVFPTIEVMGAYSVPAFRDLNRDGRDELLIPLMTGNVNTGFAVWQTNETGIFQPAGEVSTIDFEFAEDHGGLILTNARGSAVTWYRTAWRLETQGLVPVYEIMTDLDQRYCAFERAPAPDSGIDGEALLAACNEGFE